MEKRDLYDSQRNITGETILKGEEIPKGRYIIVVLVFIQNSEGKFLIQKKHIFYLNILKYEDIILTMEF